MPILKLLFKENTIAVYRVAKGKSLTIGRKEDNDIQIENLAVSGHHAKIDSVGDGFLLTDLQSKNGSFVNDELVSSHWLQQGDSVTIGKHTLTFSYDDYEKKPDEDEDQMDQTMVMDTDTYRKMMGKTDQELAETRNKAKDPVGILSYLAGGEGEIKLTNRITKIGKSPSSEIVVKGIMMGSTAVVISRRPKGYSLSYVDGMTKPKVNGEVVKESVDLKDFDIIDVGSAKFQFVIDK
ncbi:MAG: FHA domain-containing protein [Desulfobacterales bacterium]